MCITILASAVICSILNSSALRGYCWQLGSPARGSNICFLGGTFGGGTRVDSKGGARVVRLAVWAEARTAWIAIAREKCISGFQMHFLLLQYAFSLTKGVVIARPRPSRLRALYPLLFIRFRLSSADTADITGKKKNCRLQARIIMY
jgi:hypothetical protein